MRISHINELIKYFACQVEPQRYNDDDCDIEAEGEDDCEERNSEPQDSSSNCCADMSLLTEDEKLDILSERDFGHKTGIKGFD